MSLQYNDQTTHKGIIQKIERNIYGMDAVGKITGNTTLFKQWTADVNIALDRALTLIFQADGRWQFDDSNHSGYPTITTNLVASQRNYDFTEDSAGNLLLEIHKVYVLNNGIYSPLEPVDEMEESGFFDGQEATGLPYQYGKKADGIFLDPVPNANVTSGLKVEISREGSYFTTSDTTKKPGFDGLLHEYLAIQPSAEYAKVNNLANMAMLERRRLEMEDDIIQRYSKRAKDERDVLEPEPINYL